MKNILLLFLFWNIAAAAQIAPDRLSAYNSTAESLIRSSLMEQKGYEWLRELCEIGPRLSGSENSIKAIHWAADKMRSLGFDSVWLQPVMVPHWQRGDKESAVIINENRTLHIASLGGSVATPPNGITAEVVEVTNFDELKLLGSAVKDKIVFFNRPLDAGLVNTFAGYGGAVNQRSSGAIKAAEFGAAGVIIRSITTKMNDNVPHTGVMYYVDSLPKIPAAAIGSLDADYISSKLKSGEKVTVSMEFNCKTLPDAQSYNVIGEIKGAELPDEVIVVGGHYDSWDSGCGAHDDGAGCLQSMEVLDLFKRLGINPKRTIRAVFFINEENGTMGGKTYGAYASSAPEKHVAAIESDRGAFTPRGFSVTADSIKIAKMRTWLPVLKKSLIDWIEPGGSGVDIYYIKNAEALIGYVPDAQRYMDVHHSANDTFESVHPREMQLGTAAMAILTYLISEEGL